MNSVSNIRVVDYEDAHQQAFERLNTQWLEQYFVVEDIDRAVLADPKTHILSKGGHILCALDDSDIVVGVVSMIAEGDAVFELSKMAVDPSMHGAGIGRKLMVAALDWYERQNGVQLFLESNRKLTPALTLYESVGFRHHPAPRPGSHYDRADVYMIYEPESHE